MHRKKLILLLIFIVAISLLFLTVRNKKPQQDTSEDLLAPSLEIRDETTGRKMESGDLKNKVLFVNFWASWCQPCRDEMPSIESLFKEMLANEKFQVLTILYKDSYQDGTAYMKQNGYTFPVYSDITGITARNFGVTGVPETYIIDKKGILKKRIIGPADWSSPEVKTYLNSLLNE